jgi:hypothetical protein
MTLGLCLTGATADASLLASDAFVYDTGSTLGVQSAAGAGWSTGWMSNAGITTASGASVSAGSLTAPGGYSPAPSGGSAIQAGLLAYRGLDASAQIDLSVDKDYYISYLAERTPVPVSSRSFSFQLQTGGVTGGDLVVNVGTSTGGDPFVALGASGTVLEDLNLIGNGSTDLWVIKIAASAALADQVFLKVYDSINDTVDAAEPATWSVISNSELSSSTITQLGFAISGNATLQIDEVRIGESWADVVPVPEPASAGLMLLGLGLATRRLTAFRD